MLSKNMKKAQGLSINTIIIALIALLVLVVVIAILTGNIKIFTGTTTSCNSRQGVCEWPSSCTPPSHVSIGNTDCDNIEGTDPETSEETHKVCCVEILKTQTEEE